MIEDLRDHRRVLDQGDQLHPPEALGAHSGAFPRPDQGAVRMASISSTSPVLSAAPSGLGFAGSLSSPKGLADRILEVTGAKVILTAAS